MNLINQELSRKAGKYASKFLLTSNNGVEGRKRASMLFIYLGIFWILIMLGSNWMASSAPKPNPFSTKIMMLLLSIGIISIFYGVIQLILLKKSAKFREWSNKDYKKDILKIAEIEKNSLQQFKIVFLTLLALCVILGILILIII